MNEPLAAPVSTPRAGLFSRVLPYFVRVPLGLFILWQIVFLFGYNLSDMSISIRNFLRDARDDCETQQSKEQPHSREAKVYLRVINLPLVGELLEEWVRVDASASRLGGALNHPRDVVEWWARQTGQEQGWSLFAPNTVTWTCFVAVELRWDDEVEPLRATSPGLAAVALTGTAALRIRDGLHGVAPAVILPSPNEPADIRRFIRFGHYRTRRTESSLETGLRLDGSRREDRLASWTTKVRDKVRDQDDYLRLFLRWRLRRFQAEFPQLPPPRQVILRSHTWAIPGPEYRPWDWIEQSDEPVVRWRPHRFPITDSDALELYLHDEERFENKALTRWTPPAKMPGSSD